MIRIAALLIGGVFGLFQTGYFVGRLHGIDIRQYGSGNAGTTNALRTLGTKWGFVTLAGDFFKSFLAVLLVGALFGKSYGHMLPLLKLYAGFGCVLSHDFPFYLHFRGGKGVAATAGMLAAFDPLFFGIIAVIFLTLFFVTHYVSLASLTAYGIFCPLMILLGLTGHFHMSKALLIELDLLALCMTALCWWQHRENLRRLAAGTERKTNLFK